LSHITRLITEQENENPIKQVTEEEVKKVIISLHPDKAPGFESLKLVSWKKPLVAQILCNIQF